MIVKPIQIPLIIKKLEALLRRLPPNHPKRPIIEKELASRFKGYRGEQFLDFYLQEIPSKDHLILHDIRLPALNSQFQMDLLILTPYYLLNLEVKNFSGSLLFDETHQQLIRTHEGKEEGFAYPIIQIQRHKKLLTEWLTKNRLPPLPIECLVVISSPRTIIRTKGSPSNLKYITRSSLVPEKIEHLNQLHTNEILSKKQLKRLSNLLIKQHTSQTFDPLEYFLIPKTDLLIGIHCPKCFTLPMKRKRGKWVCIACLHSSSDAHISSL
ncbi:NERD domain-containing protein [Fictibacillus sp. KIGAM418]|uniref:NERD domain-containing protein n=1 Tax=Fictibacillus marinisediminis TaxID=2878389 RepID=A0A9X1XDG4_9BACL|nr:nuclease-related domain-containing protein [Fictibacillus marinisediminis]MCK6258618.1 NERD domain-containing protein [Fictibacillus marinisediminis]